MLQTHPFSTELVAEPAKIHGRLPAHARFLMVKVTAEPARAKQMLMQVPPAFRHHAKEDPIAFRRSMASRGLCKGKVLY